MPHCLNAQSLNGANAHQAAARHCKHCQIRGGLGRQFRECHSLLQNAHARLHKQDLRSPKLAVTCTAVAEAAPEVAERGELAFWSIRYDTAHVNAHRQRC